MEFHRTRPWRPRWPSFGSRAGSRRRGASHDLVLSGPRTPPDSATPATALSEDLVVAVCPLELVAVRPPAEPMLMAGAPDHAVLALQSGAGPSLFEALNDAVVASRLHTKQGGEDASRRRSA